MLQTMQTLIAKYERRELYSNLFCLQVLAFSSLSTEFAGIINSNKVISFKQGQSITISGLYGFEWMLGGIVAGGLFQLFSLLSMHI